LGIITDDFNVEFHSWFGGIMQAIFSEFLAIDRKDDGL